MFSIIYIDKKQVTLILTDINNIDSHCRLKDSYDIEEVSICLCDSVEVYRNGSKEVSVIPSLELNIDTDLISMNGDVYKILHFIEV